MCIRDRSLGRHRHYQPDEGRRQRCSRAPHDLGAPVRLGGCRRGEAVCRVHGIREESPSQRDEEGDRRCAAQGRDLPERTVGLLSLIHI